MRSGRSSHTDTIERKGEERSGEEERRGEGRQREERKGKAGQIKQK